MQGKAFCEACNFTLGREDASYMDRWLPKYIMVPGMGILPFLVCDDIFDQPRTAGYHLASHCFEGFEQPISSTSAYGIVKFLSMTSMLQKPRIQTLFCASVNAGAAYHVSRIYTRSAYDFPSLLRALSGGPVRSAGTNHFALPVWITCRSFVEILAFTPMSH